MSIFHSLNSVSCIHKTDPSGLEYFGCDQNWYTTHWQRIAGCGPSTAATLLHYLQKTGRIELPIQVVEQRDCRLLMDSVWDHVTPTSDGIYCIEQFCQGIDSFARSNGFQVTCHSLDIEAETAARPAIAEVQAFVAAALDHDCPVAFLNLCRGTVDNLEEWHWVTIVALEEDLENQQVFVSYFDGDRSERINFSQWIETTDEGGALIYLETKDPATIISTQF
jgi:hypothetical protein